MNRVDLGTVVVLSTRISSGDIVLSESPRSEEEYVVTRADMWTTCTRAAGILDSANGDWHRLSEVEDALWPLVSPLDQATVSASVGSRHLQILRGSLDWVRQNEYGAPEIELERHLHVALQSAMHTLECLERSPWPCPPPNTAMEATVPAAGTRGERDSASPSPRDARLIASRVERAKASYCAEMGTTRL
jgi:hypothetical protein